MRNPPGITANIFAAPDLGCVRRLWADNGLPTNDLRPAKMAHFITVGAGYARRNVTQKGLGYRQTWDQGAKNRFRGHCGGVA